MDFPESVKKEARRKAHFRCVVCREKPFVEVHHIIPQEFGGSNTLDNAAPLCAGCHDYFGNNSDKRKQIKEMRDQWYEICETRYANPDIHFYVDQTEKIEQALNKLSEKDAENAQTLQMIQKSLSEVVSRAGESIKMASDFAVVGATSGYVGTAFAIAGTVLVNDRCPNCQTLFAFRIAGSPCPVCGKTSGPTSSSP